MSFAPITLIASQYEDFENYWFKCYEQGTVTPLTMYNDAAGTTPFAKLEINVSGFLVSSGGAIQNPHVGEAYDAWLFPTEAEADADDTDNAIQIADNVDPSGELALSTKLNPLTVAAMTADTSFTTADVGVSVPTTKEFSTGNGGGATYDVISGTGTANGFNIIAHDTENISFVLRIGEIVDVTQFGATDSVSTGAIQAAWSLGGTINHPNTTANIFLINDTLTIGSNTTLLFADNVSLKLAPSIAKTMITNADASNTNIVIKGGIFDVDEANQTTQEHCIRFDNVSNSYFERVDVRPTHFVSGPVSSWHNQDCDNNTFIDCILNASAGEGLLLIGDDNNVIRGDYSDNGNGSGVQASGDRNTYDGITLKNNSGSPISVHGKNAKVINNTIEGGGIVGTNGINMGHSGDPVTDAIVQGNTIRNFDGANGIRCNSRSNNVLIVDNVITGLTRVSSAGVGVGDNSRRVSIINNRASNCQIGFSASKEGVVVQNNIAEGCSANGFSVFAAKGGTVSNNISRNNGANGFDFDSASFNLNINNNQSYDDADDNGIFLVKAVGGAGALALDGALVSSGVAYMSHARKIVILSSGNDSGITFTVTGTDLDDAALVEIITGGNATTADSTKQFKTISSIVASGAAAANVTIGELATQMRGIVINAATAAHIVSNNHVHGNTVGPFTNPGGNEVQGNRFSLTDELVVPFTMIASGVDITITNANIVTGSRITIVPTSAEAVNVRNLWLKSQAIGSCVIGNTGGAAGATFEVHIK